MSARSPEGLEPIPFLDVASMTREVADEVLAGWTQVLDSGTFIGGTAVAEFESELARLCGTEHAVGVANGTDALHLAFRALGLGPGDQVIVPTNTFVATAEAVVLAGAEPRFADVDPDTLLITPETIKAAYGPRCRAVVVVHLFGQTPDMDAVAATTDDLGMVLVEDAAQAQGARWRGRPAGSFGALGCFSFYPGKNLGAFGDAGAIVTRDDRLADRLRSLRDHGRVPGAHHQHAEVGMNSRLDAVQAVVLSAKLRRLPAWNLARQELIRCYSDLLDPDAAQLVARQPEAEPVHHVAVARVLDRDRLREELAREGIATGIHYPTPCHVMAPYRGYADEPLPVAETAAREIVSLPMSPHLAPDAVERVCSAVNRHARRWS